MVLWVCLNFFINFVSRKNLTDLAEILASGPPCLLEEAYHILPLSTMAATVVIVDFQLYFGI